MMVLIVPSKSWLIEVKVMMTMVKGVSWCCSVEARSNEGEIERSTIDSGVNRPY